MAICWLIPFHVVFTIFCTPCGFLPSAVLSTATSFILQALPLTYSVPFYNSFSAAAMFHWKIQFWRLSLHYLIVLFPLWHQTLLVSFVPPHIQHLYSEFNKHPVLSLCLILLWLHRSSISTVFVSHRDTCSVVSESIAFLKTFFFKRFADPGSVTVNTKSSEELLLSLLKWCGRHLGLGVWS